jgi:hypothetical protein
MDLSEYVKDGIMGKEIDKTIIAKLLDAKNGKVKIYAVVTSIYKNEKDIGGGFFARALNVEHLFSKNYVPAEEKFKEIYDNLKKEHTLFSKKLLDKSVLRKKGNVNIGCGKFKLSYFGNLDFLYLMNIKEGNDASRFGDKLSVSLNRCYLALADIVYSDREKALCYTYEYNFTNYVPIVLD